MSADGETLLAVQNQVLAMIQVVTPGQESEARSLSAGSQNLDGQWGLAWTPDGKIVYSSTPRRDLWKRGADGSTPRRLTVKHTSSPAMVDPVVPLRGGFIAFDQWDPNGEDRIWRMEMDGSNLKQLTEGKRDLYPAVSPDGQWVVFTRSEDGKSVLMRVPSRGGPASQLTDYRATWPSVSPDGKWMACFYFLKQDQPISLEIAIVPFAGGQPAKIFPLPAAHHFPLLWTPDGRAISFVNSVNGVGNIWEQPLAGGPPKPVTHFTSGRISYFDWSRDGRLALSRSTNQTDVVLIKNFR